MRPIKMNNDDFLKLLYTFNHEGIHFKWFFLSHTVKNRWNMLSLFIQYMININGPKVAVAIIVIDCNKILIGQRKVNHNNKYQELWTICSTRRSFRIVWRDRAMRFSWAPRGNWAVNYSIHIIWCSKSHLKRPQFSLYFICTRMPQTTWLICTKSRGWQTWRLDMG